MCFKNVFVETNRSPPTYDTTQNVAQQSDMALLSNFQLSDTPVYVDGYSTSSPGDLLDPFQTSPLSHNVVNDLFPCDAQQIPVSRDPQSTNDLPLDRKPVFAGYARPPEYAYQRPSDYSHFPYFLQIQGLDLGPDVNQFSPEEDLDVKFAMTPATSLNDTGNLQTPTLCKVCDDVASGNHFGVLSCEACKSFFRRSVRAGARYACRASRNCAIEKHTRNRCQYCRLQKCMQMGMRREAVQEERAPPVSKLHRAETPTQLGYTSAGGMFLNPPSIPTNYHTFDGPVSPVVPSFMTQSRMFGSLPNLKVGLEQERMQQASGMNSSYFGLFPSMDSFGSNNSRPTTPNSAGPYSSSQPMASVPPPNPFGQVSASILVNADVQTDIPPENVNPVDRGVKLEDIFEGARQSLLRVIEWGKRIPAFTALNLDDQVKLLKSSWCEHVLMKLATRIGPKTNTVLLSSGITCSKDQIEDPEIRRIVERVSNDISYWFDIMHVDRVEMACLKGIILFNPDAKGLNAGTRKRVEIFQEQILQALETRCRTVYPVTPLRFSKLLLRLAPLKASALEATQHMEVQRTLGNTKMDDIFGELLDFD